MRATLEVDEQIAQRLRELAAATGVSIDQLLANFVPGLRSPQGKGSATDNAVAGFDEWASDFPEIAAPLSDEAISRASIYPDR